MKTTATIEPERAVADCASNQDSISNVKPVLVDFKLSADVVQKYNSALIWHARGNNTLKYTFVSDAV